MSTSLIIGSGPAAAGAALALSRDETQKITVIDIGVRLESERQAAVEALSSSSPSIWDSALVESISKQPVETGVRGVPEKRVYGSDYPFRDVGQLRGMTASTEAGTSLISGAYGGFSNVWGSQLMPFTASTFESWPFGASVMNPHYQAILGHIPFAGEDDDLADRFPLLSTPAPLPSLSARSRWVLDSYARHREALNGHGVTMGSARLAFRPKACVQCGMCMTGCPYGLIYSAAQTFDVLRREKRVTYRDGLLAVKLIEGTDGATVVAREVTSGTLHTFEADRVFVACGAIGTTRLVAGSLGLDHIEIPMVESQQFILPMLSARPTPDPRNEPTFTLNQFNMVVDLDDRDVDVSQLHFYTYNSSFGDALPSFLKRNALSSLRGQLLRRLTVALGYLPSWDSPRLLVRTTRPGDDASIPELHLSRETAPPQRNAKLRSVLWRLGQSAPLLDLYPVLPMLRLAAGGKSYHVGGSFPHTEGKSGPLASDSLGRVGPWRRIHLVDASVFPNVPATTFTFTIMANAHRIASRSQELSP